MSAVQGPFDNRYTPPSGLVHVTMRMNRRPAGPGWVTAAASVLVLASLVLLPGLGGAAPVPSSTVGPSALPQNSPWAAYPTGPVRVVFPSTLPQVYLVDASNASMGAFLQVDALLELGAGGLPRPTIVAAAYPTEAASFNSTPTSNLSLSPLSQSASLDVHAIGGTLWSSTGVATIPGPMLGAATLSLTYSVLPSPSTGVDVEWNVVGWPWVHATDLLALEVHFDLTSASEVIPCTGTGGTGVGPAVCAGATLPGHGITWDPTIQSLVAHEPGGDSATLAWSPTATIDGGASAALAVGTFAESNASAELVLAAPAAGSTHLSGALQFSLFTPLPPIPPAVLHGGAVPYASGLLVSAALSAIGVALYRRRERRVREEL